MDTGTAVSRTYDLVVVGSGIAGLYTALLAAPHRSVLLVTKGALEESNTRYAQGGIAVALAKGDSPELHRRDTLAAGDGLCDPSAVAVLTDDGRAGIFDLLDRGVAFDRDVGELAWTLEAAHSLPRVLHVGGDATGAAIERTLAGAVRAADVDIVEHALCTSIITRDGYIGGVELLHQGNVVSVRAQHVVLATGGAGQLFARTTNPSVATGDGIALAYWAGAELMDMEMVQFHPTAIVLEGAPSFLISEAVRGEGGVLRDIAGRAFMADYHQDRELAPRDVVARAIHSQMLHTDSAHVWLDVSHLPAERVERRFPGILRFCRDHGIDPLHAPIPVAPAAHYLMGGIRTDLWGRTSLPGLFACGEAACTGVHGANRLASNSLLEGLVFARRVVQSISGETRGRAYAKRSYECRATTNSISNIERLSTIEHRHALGEMMWQNASVVRSWESLTRANEWLKRHSVRESTAGSGQQAYLESANLELLAHLLVQSALLREESRGAHFRSDFPQKDAAWQKHIVLSRDGVFTLPVRGSHAVGASRD